MSFKNFRVYFKGQLLVEATSKKTAKHLAKYILNIADIKEIEISQVRKL